MLARIHGKAPVSGAFRTLIGWGIFIIVVLSLELTLFNLPHWQTAGLTPQQLFSQETLEEGQTRTFTFAEPEDVHTLRISANRSCQITLGLIDEGSTAYPMPVTHKIYQDVPSSQYLQIHPYGKLSKLSVTFDEFTDIAQMVAVGEDQTPEVSFSAVANVPIPLNLSPLRVIVIILVAAFLWAFLPARRMYQLPVFEAAASDASQRLMPLAKRVLAVVVAILCVASLAQLGVIPYKLGEYGKGYSTISVRAHADQIRAEEHGYAVPDESSSTAEESSGAEEAKGTDAGDAVEDSGSGSRVQEGAADKSSQIQSQPYADLSPLAYVYPSVYEAELGKLARAFAAGQLYLLDEPYPELQALDNPYDWGQRADGVGSDIAFYWDTAYYDGHYYVYFGALPVLAFYLPYFLITGQDLPNYIPIALCLIALLIGVAVLLVQIARRWFPSTSLGTMVLCLMLVFFGSQLGWLLVQPSIYEVPVAMALALLVWAAVCFISLEDHPWRAVVGALLTALIFACRPQIGLFGLLFIPFGIQALRSMKGAKARMLYLGAALAPIVGVFAFIAWYNAARFGNPLDFGAAYNLTTNDMRYRPVTLDIALISLFSYLVQLPVLQPSLPFLDPVFALNSDEARTALQQMWNYAGNIVVEAPIGGLLWLSPLVWFILALFMVKPAKAAGSPSLRTGSLLSRAAQPTPSHPSNLPWALRLKAWFISWRGFALLGLILTLIVIVIDGEGAGILPRYVLDFALPLLILGAAGFMMVRTREQRWSIIVGFAMLLIGLVVFFAVAFHPNVIRESWVFEMEKLLASLNYLLFS